MLRIALFRGTDQRSLSSPNHGFGGQGLGFPTIASSPDSTLPIALSQDGDLVDLEIIVEATETF